MGGVSKLTFLLRQALSVIPETHGKLETRPTHLSLSMIIGMKDTS